MKRYVKPVTLLKLWLLFPSTVLLPEDSDPQQSRAGHTYICVTEPHSARLPLAQEQELVVGIHVRRAPVLLVPAAHLAGIICFCNEAANLFLGSTKSHLQPTTPRVPWLSIVLTSFPTGKAGLSHPILSIVRIKPKTQSHALCNILGTVEPSSPS